MAYSQERLATKQPTTGFELDLLFPISGCCTANTVGNLRDNDAAALAHQHAKRKATSKATHRASASVHASCTGERGTLFAQLDHDGRQLF